MMHFKQRKHIISENMAPENSGTYMGNIVVVIPGRLWLNIKLHWSSTRCTWKKTGYIRYFKVWWYLYTGNLKTNISLQWLKNIYKSNRFHQWIFSIMTGINADLLWWWFLVVVAYCLGHWPAPSGDTQEWREAADQRGEELSPSAVWVKYYAVSTTASDLFESFSFPFVAEEKNFKIIDFFSKTFFWCLKNTDYIALMHRGSI